MEENNYEEGGASQRSDITCIKKGGGGEGGKVSVIFRTCPVCQEKKHEVWGLR